MTILQQSDDNFFCPNHRVTSTVQGNIVPHSWYTQITSDSGRPDHNAISIFSEIVYWYRPNREGHSKFVGDAWQTSYKHFEKRFSYNSELIRRTLVRLEKLGLARREFRTIEKFGQKYSNVLFIRLLVDIASDGSIIRNNCYTNNICPEMHSGELILSSFSSLDDKTTSSEYEQNICLDEIVDFDSKKTQKLSLPLHEFATPSPQICGQHYIDKENKLENKENRSDLHASVLSIFSFSLLDEGKELSNNEQEQNFCLNEVVNLSTKKNLFSSISDKTKKFLHKFGSKSKPLDWKEGRGLSELSGISEEDKDILNQRSGRQFSINFIDQLILKLGIKCPEHKFYRKEQFMNYMVKALSNEILQAPQANNEDFKFACLPKTEEEKFQNRINKYCEEIESSTSTFPEMLLKKKILGRLDPGIAYEVLTGTSIAIDSCDSSLCNIKTLRLLKIQHLECKKASDIPEWIRQIILEEVRGVYGNQVSEFKHDDSDDTYFVSDSFISNRVDTTDTLRASHNLLYSSDDILLSKTIENSSPMELMWLRVKNKLKEMYGDKTYRLWFSGLKIEPSKSDNLLKIAAPTSFIRDWVKKDYGHILEREIKMEDPSIRFVEFASN